MFAQNYLNFYQVSCNAASLDACFCCDPARCVLQTLQAFNLYDVGALAHRELLSIMPSSPTTNLRADLIASFKTALTGWQQQVRSSVYSTRLRCCVQSMQDPFHLGFAYTDDLDAAPMIMGLSVASGFYGNITGDRQFDDFGAQQVCANLRSIFWLPVGCMTYGCCCLADKLCAGCQWLGIGVCRRRVL